MACSLNKPFQVQTCLKWKTDVPKANYPIESSDFWYQGIERHLKLVSSPKKPSGYFLYLVSSRHDEDTEPFEIVLYIDGPNEPIRYRRVQVENAVQMISSYFIAEICDMMREYRWRNLTFVIQFPGTINFHEGESGLKNTSWDLESLRKLSSDIGKMFKEPSYYDMELECEGEIFKGHEDILSARSAKFAELKQSLPYVPSRPAPNTFRIVDLDKDSLRDVLAYAYTGTLSAGLTEDSAKRLCKAARLYSFDSLVKKCTDFLVKNLNNDNVYEILHLADLNREDDLKESVIVYIWDHKIMLQEKWLSFRERNWQLAMEVYHKFYLSHCE